MTRPEFDQVGRVGELVLPPELMRRVALFIPDVATFFSFLETYDSAGILGDLGMIRILGESCLYEKLWPDLHVGTRPESPRASQMLVVAKHYSHFALSGVVDVAWMQELCRVAPATDLHATDIRPAWKEAMEPFVDALAKLPLTRATFSIPRSEIWVPFLPRLCDSLRSLRFTFHDHTGLQPSQLGTLLEFVCGSSQITNLTLENDPFSPLHVVTTAMVGHLTKWFHLAPVTHFRVGQWQLAEVDPSALTSLYDAWATCSTLEALVVVETKLLHLEAFPHPLPMATVQLIDCDLSLDAMNAFGLALHESNVESLSISHRETFKGASSGHVVRGIRNHLGNSFGFARCLHRVVLSGLKCRDKGCVHLAAILSSTPIRHLDLSRNHITDIGAAAMSLHLRAAPCLKDLVMDGNCLTVVGALDLARAAVARNLSSLSITNNQYDLSDVDALKVVAQQHGNALRLSYKSTTSSKFFKRLPT